MPKSVSQNSAHFVHKKYTVMNISQYSLKFNLRIMIRLGEFDIAVNTHSHLVVTDDVLNYLKLSPLPDGYKQHPKIKTMFDASATTNMATFVAASGKRAAKRAEP